MFLFFQFFMLLRIKALSNSPRMKSLFNQSPLFASLIFELSIFKWLYTLGFGTKKKLLFILFILSIYTFLKCSLNLLVIQFLRVLSLILISAGFSY